MRQLDLFETPPTITKPDVQTGEELRDEGIKKAVDHANLNTPDWSDMAYAFLLRFIKDYPVFMAEDVRLASVGIIPEPPSDRAWGGIIRKASYSGLIERDGFKNVTNPKAHCTPASVWRVKES